MGWDLVGVRAYAYARNGRADEARGLLKRLEASAGQKPLAYEIAAVYAALGQSDRGALLAGPRVPGPCHRAGVVGR